MAALLCPSDTTRDLGLRDRRRAQPPLGAEPDFGASLQVLDRYTHEIDADELNGLWPDLTWGLTLLGLERPEAVGHIVRAARFADRMSSPGPLDPALRQLAVVAAEAGLTEQAAALVAYPDANLGSHRLATPVATQVQLWLDRALAEPAKESSLDRNEALAPG